MSELLLETKANTFCQMSIYIDGELICGDVSDDRKINLEMEKGRHLVEIITKSKSTKKGLLSNVFKNRSLRFDAGAIYNILITKTRFNIDINNNKPFLVIEAAYVTTKNVFLSTGYALAQIQDNHGLNIENEQKNILPKEELASFILSKILIYIFIWIAAIYLIWQDQFDARRLFEGTFGMMIAILFLLIIAVFTTFTFIMVQKFIKQNHIY